MGSPGSCPLRRGPLELGLMSVAKLQVSLVRLVRSTMLELLPLCAYLWIFVSSPNQIPSHQIRSGPPYRCLFFTQTQSDQNPHTKSGQNRAKSKNFLVPCDSRVHSEGIFIRPGSHLAGKHAHCELCYHSLKFRFFRATFYSSVSLLA